MSPELNTRSHRQLIRTDTPRSTGADRNASKGRVVQLSRTLANEWARRGPRVTSLSPGYTETR